MPDSRDVEAGFDPARQALTEQIERLTEQLEPYQELVQARDRAEKALAALEGGKALKKRVQWEQLAEYVAEHPGSKPAEIAAALEVPLANVHAHLARNQDTVFDKRQDGIYLKKDWETHRRDTDDR
ncbi:MAG TPA: hypothetical protein VID48_14875 [Solirubrobacteraceae bacterium]